MERSNDQKTHVKIEVRVHGYLKLRLIEKLRHASAFLTLEKPTAIHYLVDCVLEIQPPEAIVLVNGRYSSPDYILQDGDSVYIFSPLAGG